MGMISYIKEELNVVRERDPAIKNEKWKCFCILSALRQS